MSHSDWKAWPEDLPPRFNGGVRCDAFFGPCACGATHSATERLGQALQDAGLRAYLHKPGCDMKGGDCSMGCGTPQAPQPARMPCPYCGIDHIDIGAWQTRPHHKHLCLHCGKLFRFEGADGEYFYGIANPDHYP